jgi:hypothetical protein
MTQINLELKNDQTFDNKKLTQNTNRVKSIRIQKRD